MNVNGFRAPAVPLITHDPFFSLWSHADELTGDSTRHWTGTRQYMFGIIVWDGVIYEFMGKVGATDDRYFAGYEKLVQTSCEIRPMTTIYRFSHAKFDMELVFTSPLLLNDLEIMSRPVSYVDYRIIPKDCEEHEAVIQFGFSGEFCVNETTQKVHVELTNNAICFSSGTEHMLKQCGDDHRIEWGTLHVVAPDYVQESMSLRSYHLQLTSLYGDRLQPVNIMHMQGPHRECKGPDAYQAYEWTTVHPHYPTILVKKLFTVKNEAVSGSLALAYDDVKSLQYFGENIEAYWRKDGISFSQMLQAALSEKGEILAKVAAFEEQLLEQANQISPKYADIVSLAYRQTIAGHKLTWHKGELQFVSKENYSNGCAATVDVTYPSIPLFLLYEPKLVEGMLNPIFHLLEQGMWEYDFAPHDAGTYPRVNGQFYGFSFRHRKNRPNPKDSQMPVEECGNMLLCVAGLCFAEKDMTYFEKHRAVLKKWADYLVCAGFDPNNQLCTDDFAGFLAHNCNLSVKAICALGAYAKLLEHTESSDAAFYRKKAEEFAAEWEKAAFDGDHYRLAFDRPGSWSLKYNMVWDKLLNLNLFSQKVYDLELAWYKKQMHKYGIPLDGRMDGTKTDWEMWSTVLFDDKEYTDMVVDSMWSFLCDTPESIPFSDLIFTSKPYAREFTARTVQGGLFINMLQRNKPIY